MLDLERLQRITDEVRNLTGSAQTAYTVAVLPRVDVDGRVGGEAVDATFAPALSFDVGDLRLQPSFEGGEGVGPFAPREPGTGTRAVAGGDVARRALALGRRPRGASRCSGSPSCCCSAGSPSPPDAGARTATSTSGSSPATGTCSFPSPRAPATGST